MHLAAEPEGDPFGERGAVWRTVPAGPWGRGALTFRVAAIRTVMLGAAW